MDLNKLESKLDDALSKETTESLTNYLNIKRMEKKQTAVEWLAEQMMHPALHNPYIEQTKEMDKEQKIEAYRDGRTDQQSSIQLRFYHRSAENWYNETYKK